jgi:hypothetical protein
MRTWTEIWRGLSKQDRVAAAEAFWGLVKKRDSAWQFGIDYLADMLRARPAFVEKSLSPAKRVELLAKQEAPPEILLGSMLGLLMLKRRPHMLRRFSDAVGIPHENGHMEQGTYKKKPPERAAIERAVSRVFAEFDAEDVRLYLDCLEGENPVFWKELAGVRAEVEAKRAKGGATERVPQPPTAETEPAAEAATPARGRDPLTNLDHAVLDAVVASVAGGVGALSEDQVRDLVEEFVALNPKRLASYFHRGFLDVLSGQEPSFDWPEANAERRAWYLCGLLAGLARRNDHAGIVRTAESRREEARALGAGEGAVGSAAAVAAPLLFEAFLAVKGPAAAAEAVHAPAVAQAGLPLFRRILEVGAGLLRGQRADEAGLLLDRLQGALGVLESFGMAPPPEDQRELRRRQAHRARLLGDHEKARALLESLLREGAGAKEAMIRADLGLIACGFRSLGEVRLPGDPAGLPETVGALAKGERSFREAAGLAGEGGHAEYCLGVLLLARGDRAGARAVLSRAVSQMERRTEVYEPIRVLARARLYQARCLAATLDPAHVEHAVEKLASGGQVAGAEAPWIVRETLYDVASCDPESAARAARALEPFLGDVVLDAAGESDLLPRIPSLREALVRRAEHAGRPPSKRFDDYEVLLQVGRKIGDLELARKALDGLEVLAQAGPERDRLMERLGDPEYFRPAWAPEDAGLFRARGLETAGRLPEAAAVLTALAHGYLAGGDHDGEAAARDLLERIRALGAGPPDEGLVRRLEAAPARAAEVVPATVAGSVLFIGGNETQERYREDLVRWAKERWPKVTLTLEFPGWSSNWGRELPRIANLIREADAVVIMRFIRTLLGQHVRRLCSEASVPWVACTGHGRDSMRNAIEAAVARIAQSR